MLSNVLQATKKFATLKEMLEINMEMEEEAGAAEMFHNMVAGAFLLRNNIKNVTKFQRSNANRFKSKCQKRPVRMFQLKSVSKFPR